MTSNSTPKKNRSHVRCPFLPTSHVPFVYTHLDTLTHTQIKKIIRATTCLRVPASQRHVRSEVLRCASTKTTKIGRHRAAGSAQDSASRSSGHTASSTPTNQTAGSKATDATDAKGP